MTDGDYVRLTAPFAHKIEKPFINTTNVDLDRRTARKSLKSRRSFLSRAKEDYLRIGVLQPRHKSTRALRGNWKWSLSSNGTENLHKGTSPPFCALLGKRERSYGTGQPQHLGLILGYSVL
ncbi:hypothetical protein [Labrys neptuniae]